MVEIKCGDALEQVRLLGTSSVNCCVTSPPYYGLRDYGVVGQIGLEESPEQYIAKLVEVFREVRRVLRDDGTLWVNIGDSYCASATGNASNKSTLGGGKATQGEACKRPDKKPCGDIKSKDLIGIPWMLAFALRADGWYLRQEIIWAKGNPMPESVKDRCTKSHESLFLLSKSPKYYYDAKAIAEPTVTQGMERRKDPPRYGGKKYTDTPDIFNRTKSGNAYAYGETRNKRDVWYVNTQPYKEAHFATFPPKLVEPCILAGCPEGGTVLDPFFGSGTTGAVCNNTNRNCIGIELNPDYIQIAEKRVANAAI